MGHIRVFFNPDQLPDTPQPQSAHRGLHRLSKCLPTDALRQAGQSSRHLVRQGYRSSGRIQTVLHYGCCEGKSYRC